MKILLKKSTLLPVLSFILLSSVAFAAKQPKAVIDTSMGKITVTLFADQAPKTVENFIGLATKGKKAWKDPKNGSAEVTDRPLYNGTTFHRIIPDFMIQGGDPLGNGTGGPGYQFEDEFSGPAKFDKPGMLAMANAGPNTNGSQFFITVKATEWLNGKHTIFGQVEPKDKKSMGVVMAISKVKTDPNGLPDKPVVIKNIKIIK